MAVVAALMAPPADAADIPVKARPAPAPVLTWTGIYIGGHFGGGWADADWGSVSFIPAGEIFSFKPSGFVGGAHFGFNYQVGQLVLGVEGSWSGADLNDRVLCCFGLVTLRTSVSWIATVVGRAGFAFDRWLVYGSGGYAAAKLTTITEIPGCCLPGAFVVRKVNNGWVAGGGLEYMLRENVILGVDYKYIELDKHNRTAFTDQQIPVTVTDIKTQISIVTGRFAYKFPPQ